MIFYQISERGLQSEIGRKKHFTTTSRNFIIHKYMEKNFKRTLITSALPYANGPVHIGHLAGV